MTDNKYTWEGTHTISKHRLRLQKRTDRMLLMSLYESSSQICAVQFRLFGDESTEQAHSQTFDFMKKIAISYSEGKLELRNLYKERNRLLTAMGLDPKVKLQSVDHKAEAPKEDPEMPESNPEEGEEDDENEEEGDESPEEEAEEESEEEQKRDTGGSANPMREEPAIRKKPSSAPPRAAEPPRPPIAKRPAAHITSSPDAKKRRPTPVATSAATPGTPDPPVAEEVSPPTPLAPPGPSAPLNRSRWHTETIPIADLNDMWEAAA